MKRPTPNGLSEALDALAGLAVRLDSQLSGLPIEAFALFLSELGAYNEKTNLVARSDPETLVKDHLLDCLTLRPEVRKRIAGPAFRPPSLVDIGSGAGFPGIVLALALPELTVTLLEATGKKCRFLERAVAELGLGGRVTVLNERAEVVGRDRHFRAQFGFASARAIAALDVILELAFPLITAGGFLLAQKSRAQLDRELEPAKRALEPLGGGAVTTLLPDASILGRAMAIIAVEKLGATPERFPRPMSQIKRQPLGCLDS